MRALLFAAALVLLAQEHGPDVECKKLCYPEDHQPPKDVSVYACAGTCKHGETDPCAEGKEAADCGEWCRKPCCICRKVHCP